MSPLSVVRRSLALLSNARWLDMAQMADLPSEPGRSSHTARRRVTKRVERRRQAIAITTVAGLSLGVVMAWHAFSAPRGDLQFLARTNPHSVRTVDAVAALLPAPQALRPFQSSPSPGEGQWHVAGRIVRGHPAIYETTIRLPDNASVVAGVAWMDTKLLRARLYSGSVSPGGLFWKYTAPISNAASTTLVAAFNGGFLLKDSNGGYLSEGHLVAPLRSGAASLVTYKNGFATVGKWGRDVNMTSAVVAVRQNLTLLVDHGQPVPGLNPADISTWGYTLYKSANAWRSGLGVTADGALVYVVGQMNIVDLANVLVRAGAIRAMVLDMNTLWPVFASYAPSSPTGAASPTNGTDLLPTMVQSPARFFEPAYARDFVTMSAP